MLSGKLWPAHPHPYPDELLSSWIVRVAHTNGLKVQTFCAQQFGNEYQIWNRDIDRLAPTWLVETMSNKTGTPLKRAWETTLLSYQGKLYEKYHAAGQLRWILPLQIYHRTRNGFGLQFCPQCLAEDLDPYYRKSWRVALYTFCPKHNTTLLDRCPYCGGSVVFQRLELGRPDILAPSPMSHCCHCDGNLATAPYSQVEKWNEKTFQSWSKALQLINKGTPFCSRFDYSKLAVLHHFCTLIVSTRLATRLHGYICEQTHQPLQLEHYDFSTFESSNITYRHHVIGLAWWFLSRWPSRLVTCWEKKYVRYNVLLKDFNNPPPWYSKTIENMYQKRTRA